MSVSWHQGGKEEFLDKFGLDMTHDELIVSLPPESVKIIEEAGFVLVPKKWREQVLEALHQRAKEK